MRRLSLLQFQTRHHGTPPFRRCAAKMASAAASRRHRKIVVVMGPTGCGKTKLSIDLASRFFRSSEIVNSDKIQIHRGLDITTNKIPPRDRENVPHHLLGEFDSSESHPEFTPSDFRLAASLLISRIHSRRNTPFVVGGSNSFIYALLAEKFDPESDAFAGPDSGVCRGLRYSCCFIWVDVSPAVLAEHLVRRVDDMLGSGMFEELAEYFGGGEWDSVSRRGLRGAIGVPEFRKYFERKARGDWTAGDDVAERGAYEEAVGAIKDNTCQLAKRQRGKILRLRDSAGWDLKRVDATAPLRAAMAGRNTAELWERQVVEPSVKIVNRFLMGD
ncbi:adenylate isopentenyltransferase-like [Salvia miltiorrhiza]|uniref:adenylate isopentenyltransferase-like n=1 Tax=Salvia miltiorrhiza TaxID=226208 RepID=UPI0025AC9D15|nr:adenylate isopentenyltransferase-like [Salvia miltiorrhiza]